MTHLQKMSAGQVIACLAFVVSGLVQYGIEGNLTRVPDYGSKTSLFVTNGLPDRSIAVSSPFWVGTENNDCADNENCNCDGDNCEFDVSPESPRTKTFEWLTSSPVSGVPLIIDGTEFTINPEFEFECESDATTSSSC